MRPDYCPIGGEPCQSMCVDPCSAVRPKEHDPHHRLVRTLKGCGHGVLFMNYCKDCEIVSLQEQYRSAVRTVQSVRDRLRVLGQPMPGQTSGAEHDAAQQKGEA